MRFDGVIKSWNDERGFGFIEPRQGGQEIFCHIKAFRGRGARPQVGQLVSFDVELNHEGKKRARNVELARRVVKRPAGPRRGSAPWGTATYFAVAVFVALYLAVAVAFGVPRWVAGAYVGASILAFLVYALDKSAARSGGWRVPESSLLLLGLIGGWPGSIVAQQVLRHKSSKASFRASFWAVTVFNVTAFVLVFSPAGKKLLVL